MFDALLSHVAPHPCYSCGKIGSILCDNCKYDISQGYFEGCFICGNEASLTRQCSRCSTPYSRSWCIGTRSGALRQIIDSYKFYNNYDAHRTLASLLSERIGYLAGDVVIVPLPTVPSHIRVRGYDHTLLLAKRLAKLQNLRLQKKLALAMCGLRHLPINLSTNCFVSVTIGCSRSYGEVPEWFKGTVLKTVVPAMVPRVRIPPSPP
jgi:predicted amidophosphoribosyltransferase